MYIDEYQPMSEMHTWMKGRGVDVNVYICIQSVLSLGDERKKDLDVFLKTFGGPFTLQHNGSFHEYDWNIYTKPSIGYYYNKYLASGPGYDNPGKLYTIDLKDGSYASEHTHVFIKTALYEVLKRHEDLHWYIVNDFMDSDSGPSNSKFRGHEVLSTEEVKPFLEDELVKAVASWKMSKENYNEGGAGQMPRMIKLGLL